MPEINQTLGDRIGQRNWGQSQDTQMQSLFELGNVIAATVVELQINSFRQVLNVLEDQLQNLNRVTQQSQQYRRTG